MRQWFVRSGQGATAVKTWHASREAAVAEARGLRAYARSHGFHRLPAGRVRVGWGLAID